MIASIEDPVIIERILNHLEQRAGQQPLHVQRVGLARALAVDSKVLLMDEPFSAVDEQTWRKFQEDLLSLVADQNKTFLFVTHSIEEAVYVSDRVVLLSKRPSKVSAIIESTFSRDGDPEKIRRDSAYLDTVEEIWTSLKQYLEQS